MSTIQDGPVPSLFSPIAFEGNIALDELTEEQVSPSLLDAVEYAHEGDCVGWGILFHIGKALLVRDEVLKVDIASTKAPWFVFLHTSDTRPDEFSEHAADYVIYYEDGSSQRAAIRRRHEVGRFDFRWGENSALCVPARKPRPIRPPSQESVPVKWGRGQKRAATARSNPGWGPWTNYLWAFANPHPEKAIIGLGFEPHSGTLIVSAVSAGQAETIPLRWQTRRKAVVRLPEDVVQTYAFDEHDLLDHVQLDLGQVISVTPRLQYPNDTWDETRQNQQPGRSRRPPAFPRPTAGECSGPRPRSRRRRGDVLAGRFLPGHRPLFSIRLVPLSKQRLSRSSRRWDRQDGLDMGRGNDPHLRPPARQQAFHL